MLRPLIRLFFLGRAGLDIGRERIEEALDVFTVKAGECKVNGSDRLHESCGKLKESAQEISAQVWQRSEILEDKAKEKFRRQVAEFSAGAFNDSIEINELRAEIAQLRAEIAELRAARASV